MARANGQTYTEEFKAQVLADWLTGQSERSVAKKHGVSRQSLRNWAGQQRVVLPEKQASIDELQERIQRRLYKLVEDVADAASDPTYLRSQPAADLSVMVGVAADKAERLAILRVRLADHAAALEAEQRETTIDVPRISGPREDS